MKVFQPLLISALLLISQMAVADAPQLIFPRSASASVGIVVKDLASGKTIVSHNADRALTPASTMKLVTSAAALTMVGSDSPYHTRVYIEGTVADSVLKGNVVVVPSGDPTLYSEFFPENSSLMDEVARKLRKMGIDAIAGAVYVEQPDVWPVGPLPTWEIEDAAYTYAAGWFPLNFNDNSFVLNTATRRTTPEIPDIELEYVPLNKGFSVTHGVCSNLFTLRGQGLRKPGHSVSLPIPEPAAAFELALEKRIKAEGISFIAPPKNQPRTLRRELLHDNVSAPFAEILGSLMRRSDNMMAEAALRRLAPDEPVDSAIAIEMRFFEGLGLDTSAISVYDGSGLTRANQLSPKFLSEVLTAMAPNQVYTKLFPVAGRSGTMRAFGRDTALDGRMAMKTGTIRSVRCFAGYRLDKAGERPTHVVVVMVNHYTCPTGTLNRAIEKFLLQVFENN